ncbi:MAG: hypothetical protein WEB37_02610 [Bacteroidota bacterium]
MTVQTKHFALTASVLPVLLTMYLMVRYYVIVPVWDDWELVLALEKLSSGTLTFKDLFDFHNEHRIFFPRMIMLIIAALTSWNLLYTQFASLFVVLASIGFFAVSVRAIERDTSVTISRWIFLPLTIIVFSLTQWENWTRGWQFQVFLATVGVLGSFYFLSKKEISQFTLVAAISSACVASFSFANGILVWPIGFLLILLRKSDPLSNRLRLLAPWTIVAFLAILVYFNGYQTPPHHPSVTTFLEQPVEFVQFVFLYVGHVVIYPHNRIVALGVLSGIVGILGTCLFLFCICYLTMVRSVRWHPLLPFIGMGLYALSSAVVTGIGRVGFGIQAALASKYASIGLYLWVANIFFLFFIHKLADTANDTPEKTKGFVGTIVRRIAAIPAETLRKGSLGLILFIAISSIANSIVSVKKIQYYHRYFTVVIPQMIAPGDTALYARIYPDAATLDRYLAIARKNNVSIFGSRLHDAMNDVRNISSAPEPVLQDCPESPSLSVGITDFADTDSTIMCEGTATWDGSEVNSNDLFLVLSNQNIQYRIPTKEKINRFDPNGGFFVLVLKSSLPRGEYEPSIVYDHGSTCSKFPFGKKFVVQ